MVEERTAELQRVVEDLKNTQSQLLQRDKLASIGQLAAGVAHEINNPVGFVKSEYQVEIKKLLKLYGELLDKLIKKGYFKDHEIHDRIDKIQNFKEDADIDFISSDCTNAIEESLEGIERVVAIISDLKNFAHTDGGEIELTDINANLQSTLNIVWNELKYKANITKKLGEIPLVKCYPQRINQVFMNLLINAAQSMPDKGNILISTRKVDDEVEICISDNGCGIPENIHQKIYDPFFTTKDIGKGTGLGLSVVYNIIKTHNGTINIETEVGKGTTFIIKLKINPEIENSNNI